MDISTFKTRNEEAQKINIKIQQARGAIEENKRQFAELCAKYKATYNQDITAENLAQILAECEAEIEKQSEEQALAIERAKAGILVSSSDTQTEGNAEASAEDATPNGQTTGVASNINSTQPAVGGPRQENKPQQGTLGGQNTGATGVGDGANIGGNEKILAPVDGLNAGNAPSAGIAGAAQNSVGVFTPQPINPTNPVGILPTAPVAPAPTQMNNPISVSAFGAGAIQASTPVDTKMPTSQAVPTTPIQPTQQVAGWGQQGTPDFNAILGGKFGG